MRLSVGGMIVESHTLAVSAAPTMQAAGISHTHRAGHHSSAMRHSTVSLEQPPSIPCIEYLSSQTTVSISLAESPNTEDHVYDYTSCKPWSRRARHEPVAYDPITG